MKTGMEMAYIDTGMECAFSDDNVGYNPSLTPSPLHPNFHPQRRGSRPDHTADRGALATVPSKTKRQACRDTASPSVPDVLGQANSAAWLA
jgi:hypothetical protein